MENQTLNFFKFKTREICKKKGWHEVSIEYLWMFFIEEVGELAQGILKKDRAEIQDAIGDIVVVLTNLAHLEQMKIEDCVTSAYDEIKDRKGKMVNGTFEKKK